MKNLFSIAGEWWIWYRWTGSQDSAGWTNRLRMYGSVLPATQQWLMSPWSVWWSPQTSPANAYSKPLTKACPAALLNYFIKWQRARLNGGHETGMVDELPQQPCLHHNSLLISLAWQPHIEKNCWQFAACLLTDMFIPWPVHWSVYHGS